MLDGQFDLEEFLSADVLNCLKYVVSLGMVEGAKNFFKNLITIIPGVKKIVEIKDKIVNGAKKLLKSTKSFAEGNVLEGFMDLTQGAV